MMKISASEQVRQWLTALPPQSKHRVRLALRKLACGKGDIKALHPPLDGFNRLRIGAYRVLYRQVSRHEIKLEYANTRDVVYELYMHLLQDQQED